LIGILYDKRIALKERLTGLGYKVRMETGLIGMECREAYSHAKVGLDWSSLLDLNARVFELMGMGICPVINRVPDLKPLFQEEVHYLGFDTLDEGTAQFMRAMKDEDLRNRIGKAASKQVFAFHTWDRRVDQIFEVCLNG
jgi:spore maturation protein CgeB